MQPQGVPAEIQAKPYLVFSSLSHLGKKQAPDTQSHEDWGNSEHVGKWIPKNLGHFQDKQGGNPGI